MSKLVTQFLSQFKLSSLYFQRNPIQPERLPWGVPRWPQYSKDDDLFLQLAASNTRLIRTPNKRQLDDVQKTLLSDTRLQYIAENQQCTAWFVINIDKTCLFVEIVIALPSQVLNHQDFFICKSFCSQISIKWRLKVTRSMDLSPLRKIILILSWVR